MEMNNKILSFFWNNFDHLVRLMYCRTGFLGNKINKVLFWKLYSSDFKFLDNIFEDTLLALRRNKISLKDKTVLELGPGNSYINAYNFLAHGAKEVVLVDKFPRIIKTKQQKKYFDDELEFISKKYGKNPVFIEDLCKTRIEFISKELAETNLENIDFIFSNNVLEHLKFIEENVAYMSKILKQGGYMYHNIDLRDHYNFNKPFLFYKYEDSAWNKYYTKEGISYTNRLRYSDFIDLFEKYRFKISFERTKRQKLNQKKLSSEFRNKCKEDLEITYLGVLLKKED